MEGLRLMGDIAKHAPELARRLRDAEEKLARANAIVAVARECVEDQRSVYPEEPPRWTDCGCGGSMTEKLANALASKELGT